MMQFQEGCDGQMEWEVWRAFLLPVHHGPQMVTPAPEVSLCRGVLPAGWLSHTVPAAGVFGERRKGGGDKIGEVGEDHVGQGGRRGSACFAL